MALALSVKENKPDASPATLPPTSGAAAASSMSQPAAASAMPTGTTAATVSRVRALYDFAPSEPGELAFQRGDIIAVLESVYKDWWKGSLRGQTGIFPLNYVEKLQDPTQDELQREAEMEAEVFGQIKNVEKLLALLSTSSSDMSARDNDEITSLYHSTLSIRPKLIELIGKYSQKKDDFTQLNEKFIKARRDYENLLEASMSHPPPTAYGRPPPQQPYGYGAPPPSQQYPPQQSPYYPPQQQPPPSQISSPPPPQQPYPDSSIPPRNGPAPFYMLPANQPPPHAPQDPPAPVDPQRKTSGPSGLNQPSHPAAYGAPARAPSTTSRHSVQELAAGQYDSPLDHSRPQSLVQAQPTGDSAYPAPLNLHHHPHQPSAPPPSGYAAPPQPSYAPPPAPQESQPTAPPGGYHAYIPPGLQPGHPPPTQNQPPYGMAPSAAGGPPSHPGLREGGGEDVDAYYR